MNKGPIVVPQHLTCDGCEFQEMRVKDPVGYFCTSQFRGDSVGLIGLASTLPTPLWCPYVATDNRFLAIQQNYFKSL